MALRTSNKVNPNFNMSSLTDIIFLLLIFFMLTSTFVNPNALNLVLPSSNSQTTAQSPIAVSITKEAEYFIEKEAIPFEELQSAIEAKIAASEQKDPTIVLYAEKDVSLDQVVKVMNIANALNVQMILATTPEE